MLRGDFITLLGSRVAGSWRGQRMALSCAAHQSSYFISVAVSDVGGAQN